MSRPKPTYRPQSDPNENFKKALGLGKSWYFMKTMVEGNDLDIRTLLVQKNRWIDTVLIYINLLFSLYATKNVIRKVSKSYKSRWCLKLKFGGAYDHANRAWECALPQGCWEGPGFFAIFLVCFVRGRWHERIMKGKTSKTHLLIGYPSPRCLDCFMLRLLKNWSREVGLGCSMHLDVSWAFRCGNATPKRQTQQSIHQKTSNEKRYTLPQEGIKSFVVFLFGGPYVFQSTSSLDGQGVEAPGANAVVAPRNAEVPGTQWSWWWWWCWSWPWVSQSKMKLGQ